MGFFEQIKIGTDKSVARVSANGTCWKTYLRLLVSTIQSAVLYKAEARKCIVNVRVLRKCRE